MGSAQSLVPVHLAGNTTEQQNRMLLDYLGEATQEACRTALEQLDQQKAQVLLEMHRRFKTEVATLLVDAIHRHTVSDKYKDESVPSNYSYPPSYHVRPVEAQVTDLRKMFPNLGPCMEKLARRPVPEGAENWFAIPRWELLAPTYNEAVEIVVGVLGKRRKFQNRIIGRLGPTYLRQSERSQLAEKILAEQQPGSDIVVLGAQAGMLHRGSSARRVRVSMEGNEFALGVFACACILLTHPERLSSENTLMIDCSGDEYSVRGDYTFDRVPLFDFDLSGIEFSMFYEDRARSVWGTPTGFLVRAA